MVVNQKANNSQSTREARCSQDFKRYDLLTFNSKVNQNTLQPLRVKIRFTLASNSRGHTFVSYTKNICFLCFLCFHQPSTHHKEWIQNEIFKVAQSFELPSGQQTTILPLLEFLSPTNIWILLECNQATYLLENRKIIIYKW